MLPKELERTPVKDPTTPIVRVLLELEPPVPCELELEHPTAAKQTAAAPAARYDRATDAFIFSLR